jgi:hypothetical protein
VRYAMMFSLKVASEIWLRPGKYSDWLQPFHREKDQVSVSHRTATPSDPVVTLPQRDSQNKSSSTLITLPAKPVAANLSIETCDVAFLAWSIYACASSPSL